MGQNPVPSKMGGALPQNGTIGFDPQPNSKLEKFGHTFRPLLLGTFQRHLREGGEL